nr:ubiquitin conjugation factor E4 A [Leptinotarsa decemlineata]
MSSSNPFSALLEDDDRKRRPPLSNILESIFEFTLDPNKTQFLYLKEVHKDYNKTELDVTLLEYALFERLLMFNDGSHQDGSKEDTYAGSKTIINYLYHCYVKLNEKKFDLGALELSQIRDKIIQNFATSIMQPNLYTGQDVEGELFNIIRFELPNAVEFFLRASKKVIEDDATGLCLKTFIKRMNSKHLHLILQNDVVLFDMSIFSFLEVMFSHQILGDIYVDICLPTNSGPGSNFAKTTIGAILNMSILDKSRPGKLDYFYNSIDEVAVKNLQDNLWGFLDRNNQRLAQVFHIALKCSPVVREKLLVWIANCLGKNAGRGKISHVEMFQVDDHLDCVNDGYMVNLANVLLRLSKPFCVDKKILKVDPTYCAVTNDDRLKKGVRLPDLSKETCFLPVDSTEGVEEVRPTAEDYNFISECFYMTHRAIDLGVRVAIDKFFRKHKEMVLYENLFANGVLERRMTERTELLKLIIQECLSLKCVLTEPVLVENMFDFTSATCLWLCQIAVHNDFKDSKKYAPITEMPINFPLPDEAPDTLKCVPEFIIENIVSYLVFITRIAPRSFDLQPYEKMTPILSFVLIYMGSKRYMKNPHIRARLAECMECLLPQDNSMNLHTQKMFREHPHRLQIVRSLMDVYVAIETTEFEQKFNYRRPIYSAFKCIWEYEELRECFRLEGKEAEKNIEATNQPLFLKFINLVINDAIYLLDDALMNLAKLKEMQQARDNRTRSNDEETEQNDRELEQNDRYMEHLSNLIKFDNLMGRDTILTLEKLTSDMSSIFTHSTMVDRIAAMLNYFLLKLVGPQQKDYKVKNPASYEFHPARIVQQICSIYVNLKDDESFCAAISRDGRSYSAELFVLAQNVLAKTTGGGALIAALEEVASKAAAKAEQLKADDAALANAPERFFDPIMSTLMNDPVVLPSSRQTVDRSTIARHLLSDQTDPFNRSPLSLDQVEPNVELAEEIKKWKKENNVS